MMDVFNERRFRLKNLHSSNQTKDLPRIEGKIEHFVPIVGKVYLVPCRVRTKWIQEEVDEQKQWMDVEWDPRDGWREKYVYVPVINHPHSDRENGQLEVHYHRDDRFLTDSDEEPYLSNKYQLAYGEIRPQLVKGEELKYLPLTCKSRIISSITPTFLIKKSELKHKCIHKNKCPHRGFDLSNTLNIDGVITCPLHGLKFDGVTRQLLNDPTTSEKEYYTVVGVSPDGKTVIIEQREKK